MQRLHPRGPRSLAIAVDAEGAMLGPDCPLVERTKGSYRSVGQEEAALLQDFLFGDEREPDWLFKQSQRIPQSLGQGDIARAQIFGLQIPIEVLDGERLTRLARAAPFIKANFNPDEPRIPASDPGVGQWTTGEGTAAPADAPRAGRADRRYRSRAGG